MLNRLKEIAPNVSFNVSRERDDNYQWDGDGPDPIEEGYEPCDVTVTAAAIVNGEMVEGHAYLGGSYYLPDEPCGEVHGYLPQMLEEATVGLLVSVQARQFDQALLNQIFNARDWIKAEMHRRYEAERISRIPPSQALTFTHDDGNPDFYK